MSEEIPGLPGYALSEHERYLSIVAPDGRRVGGAERHPTERDRWEPDLQLDCFVTRATAIAMLTAALRVLAGTAPEFSESDVLEAYRAGMGDMLLILDRGGWEVPEQPDISGVLAYLRASNHP